MRNFRGLLGSACAGQAFVGQIRAGQALVGQARAKEWLVVMGRWPAPGRCKSRLAVALGSRRAAAIQRALSGHGLAEARRAAVLRPGLALVLAVSGLGPKGSRRWAGGLGADWVGLQGEGRLGWRLQRQLGLARRHGAQRVVLIGSDLPELAAADLAAAFNALARCDLVLGPAADGGYWLIGLAGNWPRLFAGGPRAIAWGGDQVLAQTLAVADQLGLVVTLLPIRHDLDRPEDLRRWR